MRYRKFLNVLLLVVFLGFVSVTSTMAQQGTPLPGSAIPQWVDPLPLLSVAGGPIETIVAGQGEIALTMQEFQANVMPSTFVPATGQYTGTWVWGYRNAPPVGTQGTYIGPVIVATRDTPTQIRFVNNLGTTSTSQLSFWKASTDQTLHWADPLNTGMDMYNYAGPIPAVPHLHGGDVPPVLDGGPDAWFTSDGLYQGHAYYTHPLVPSAGNEAVYRYPNSQEAAPIWFHDHVLGATRLNVYAGIAGGYAITDPDLVLPTGLHPVGLSRNGAVDYLIPLVIQDRMFDTNGQLFFPNIGINPEHPYWIPEFVGDTIVVNGKVWPFLNVAPKRYRFLIINGSNARTYELFLVNPVTKVMGPPIWQIGTDGGYLDASVKIDPNAAKPALTKLVIMPGERADIIIDFAGFANQTLILRNTGRTPYPKGAPPSGSTLGQIIQIRVGAGPVADASYNPAFGTPLRTGGQPPAGNQIVRLVNPTTGALAAGVTAAKTRQLTLNEVIGAGGPLEILVNNTKWSGLSLGTTVRSDFTYSNGFEYISEYPNEGDTEVWEIVNLTADAHPIHTHLTQFQLLNRQNFNAKNYNAVYAAAFPGGLYIAAYGPPKAYDFYATAPNIPLRGPIYGGNPDITSYLQGPVMPPNANEAGWKDTVQMLPGQVTRIAVRYAPQDKAVNAADLNYAFDPNALGHGYVWHCHIIDHEDNEMMRPYAVAPKAVNRTYVQGIDY